MPLTGHKLFRSLSTVPDLLIPLVYSVLVSLSFDHEFDIGLGKRT